jgi:hypothetical protein
MAAAISWMPATTASLMDGGSQIKNIEEKDYCQERPLEGDVI